MNEIFSNLEKPFEIDLIRVPGGKYRVGLDQKSQRLFKQAALLSERAKGLAERWVEVSDYEISRFLVTNAQFEEVFPTHRRLLNGAKDYHPVVDVTFSEAVEFCRIKNVRLPSEEEWEVAALANSENQGNSDIFPSAESSNFFPSDGPNEPGQYLPNNLGIYDMSGNVFELTSNVISISPGSDIAIIKGGSWGTCRLGAFVSFRCFHDTTLRSSRVGFRVCR